MSQVKPGSASGPNSGTDGQDGLDPVARAILAALEEAAAGNGRPVNPDAIARDLDRASRKPGDSRPPRPDRYRRAVKQQAIHLARTGRIQILRNGKPVDPNDFKGVWRMRLPADRV